MPLAELPSVDADLFQWEEVKEGLGREDGAVRRD